MNPLQQLIKPRWPRAAVGLTSEMASVVSLDRRRESLIIKRAGQVALPASLVRPSFDESNITDVHELADVLGELVMSAGLSKRRRWSVALPEAATRTTILTMESAPASRAEMEEMLRWKTERNFGASPDELRVSRQRLRSDAQGRTRYLATAVRLSVLTEYEATFDALGWHAGLILPRHMGEAWWLMNEAKGMTTGADSLLVSAHSEGFTAVLLRDGQPLLVRSITCDVEDRADELYRFLLFYRDRVQAITATDDGGATETIEQMFITGEGIEQQEAGNIVEETLATRPRLLVPEDVRLSLPSNDLAFETIAAPAGLAALAWG